MKLINRYPSYDMENFSEAVACVAANIEEAYQLCGIGNYTDRDCFEHAIEIVKNWHGKRENRVGHLFRCGF